MKLLNINDFIKSNRADDEEGAALPCIICGKNVSGESYVTVQFDYEGIIISPDNPKNKQTDRYHHHAVGSGCKRKMLKQGFPIEYFNHHGLVQ